MESVKLLVMDVFRSKLFVQHNIQSGPKVSSLVRELYTTLEISLIQTKFAKRKLF
jgi:hypothetical protein